MLISLIDDDPAYQFISKKQIEVSGAQVKLLQFHDGLEALEYFTSNKAIADNLPDLVLLDINMPYMDGWQFLDEISKIDLAKKDINIYIVTSSDTTFDHQKALKYSILSGYLNKPLTTENFLKILH